MNYYCLRSGRDTMIVRAKNEDRARELASAESKAYGLPRPENVWAVVPFEDTGKNEKVLWSWTAS